MKKNIEKEYIKGLRKELGKISDVKRAMIAELSTDIREYINANPEAEYADLSDHFGSPAKVAADFLSMEDISRYKRKAKRILFWRLFGISMFTIAVCLIVFLIIAYETGALFGTTVIIH